MKSQIMITLSVLAFIAALFFSCVVHDDGPCIFAVSKNGTITERVKPVYTREELLHEGCKGFFALCGQPQQVGAFEFGHVAWPHQCSVCGATNTLFDVRYPKIETQWKSVNIWGFEK